MNEDKIKAKHYRLDYNELGLSTLCVEKDKEIERQKEIIKQLDIKNLELTTTLKEVREYIKNNYPVCAGADLLKILSGEDNENR